RYTKSGITTLFRIFTEERKFSTAIIAIKGEINFSELRNVFSHLIGPDSFSCKSTFTHLKLEPNTPNKYGKKNNFLNENDA
ncbi:Nucleic-acid-binding protein, partial [Aphis craccivora]